METTQKCCTCKEVKELSNFFKSKSTKNGLEPRCKDCNKLRNKKQYLKHKEKRIEYVINYRKENAEKIKKYRESEKNKTNRALNRQKNKKIINKKEREYRLKNIIKFRINQRIKGNKRRLLIKSTHEIYTYKDINLLKTKQSNKCIYCYKNIKNKYHIDHIVPLSKGGIDSIKNIQILCPLCNMKKHNKDPLLFANNIGRLF